MTLKGHFTTVTLYSSEFRNINTKLPGNWTWYALWKWFLQWTDCIIKWCLQ